MIFEAKNIGFEVSGRKILNNVNLDLNSASVHALIGPNGAGKTTLLNVMSGHLAPTSGALFFNQELLTRIQPERLFSIGIRRTWQHARLFNSLSVIENLMVSVPTIGERLFDAVFHPRKTKQSELSLRYAAMDILTHLGLRSHADLPARRLSVGQQKLVSFGQIILQNEMHFQPALILLDEPFSGVSQDSAKKVILMIDTLKKQGNTILMVEHNMEAAFNLSDQVLVMNQGVIFKQGTPDAVRNDKNVREIYLGK